MATLQEHYNQINEGKGNKAQFLKQARELFPQHFNQYSDFNTVTNVLKSKQIISESKGNVVTKGFDIYDWKKILAEEVKAEEKTTSKGVIDTQKHAYDNVDMKNADNINFNEIMKGFYAELKDPKNHDKTGDEIKAMVVKNLAKDILHYTKDGMFGEKGLGFTTEAPGLGTPKEPKGKFKSSGYGDLDTDKKIKEPKSNVQDSLGDKEAETSMPKKVKEMSVTPKNSAGVKKMKTPGTEKTMKLKESVMGENPYFDTDPSDGDADHDDNMKYGAENYYDKGKKAFEEGDLEKAQEYYEQALEFGSWIGWTERELPPYKSESLNENEAVYDQIADLEHDLMLAQNDEHKAEIVAKIKALEAELLRESKLISLVRTMIRESLNKGNEGTIDFGSFKNVEWYKVGGENTISLTVTESDNFRKIENSMTISPNMDTYTDKERSFLNDKIDKLADEMSEYLTSIGVENEVYDNPIGYGQEIDNLVIEFNADDLDKIK
jgi:tetratricopeptide (TPR) repeat protein